MPKRRPERNRKNLPSAFALLGVTLVLLAAVGLSGCAGKSPSRPHDSAASTAAPSQPAGPVNLKWDPSPSVVVGYHVYRGTKSGGPYERLTTAPIPTTSYSDTAVVSGRTYFYVVTSVDPAGVESAFSNEIKSTAP